MAAAAGKVPAATATEMAPASTAGMLGKRQSRRRRYRNAEQEGSDGPNNTRSRSVHDVTSEARASPLNH
jgi:hypothetical protein